MAAVRVASDPRHQFAQYEIDELLSRISSSAVNSDAADAIMASGAARHLAVRLLTADAVSNNAPRPHSAAAGGRRAGGLRPNAARPMGPVPQSTSWEGPSGSSPRYSHNSSTSSSRPMALERRMQPADLIPNNAPSRPQPDSVSHRDSRNSGARTADSHSTIQRVQSESPQFTACRTLSGVSTSEARASRGSRALPARSLSDQPERPRTSGRVEGGSARRGNGAEASSPGLITPLDLHRQVVAERGEASPAGAARTAQGEAGRVADLRRNVLEKSLSDRQERPGSAAGRCSGGGRRVSSGLGRQTVGDERGRKGKEADVWAVCDRLMAENEKNGARLREGVAESPRREVAEQSGAGSSCKVRREGNVRGHEEQYEVKVVRRPSVHQGECCKANESLKRQVEDLARANGQLQEMLRVRAGEVQRAEEALKQVQQERDALAQEMEAALHTWMATTPRASARDSAAHVTKTGVTIEEYAAVVGRVAAVEKENKELWGMLEGLSAQREAELRQTEGLRMRVRSMAAAAAGTSASTNMNGGESANAGGSPTIRHGNNTVSSSRGHASKGHGHRHQSSLHSVHSVPNPVTMSPSSPVDARRRFPTSASVPGSLHPGQDKCTNTRTLVAGGFSQPPSAGFKKKVWFGQD